MYEKMSYEKILQRMLERVSNNLDKREGSVIYDALAPAAMELMLMYIELENVLQESFGDTASREYLIRRAAERGLSPTEPTHAILKGIFNIDVPIGARFNCESLNYIAIEKIADGQFKMKCEVLGVLGNKNFGNLIPIDYIDGLESAQLTELLIPGEDEEETETFRGRYFKSFDTKPYGGNISDYIQKTNVIAGVGATMVTPIWNGGGTVKLTILNSEFDKASAELINNVQQLIDPTKDGSGVGIAPIGHIVTVDTPLEVVIDVSTSITFQDGFSFSGQKQKIIDALNSYLLEIRKEWALLSSTVVRISQIETRIMGIEGVVDIANTKINNQSGNLVLEKYQIPVFGSVING